LIRGHIAVPPIPIIVALFIIGMLIPWALRRWRSRLSTNESTIRGLVREIYGESIVSEKILRQGNAKVFVAVLRNEPPKEIQVNLTKLAKKHEEGASLAAHRTVIGLDRGLPAAI
jgi:hypothetical protein